MDMLDDRNCCPDGGRRARSTAWRSRHSGALRRRPPPTVTSAILRTRPSWVSRPRPLPLLAWAGAIAGAVALSAAADPALPFQTLPLRGVLPAPLAARFGHAERETLLSDGIATHTVDRTGIVALERMVTTYQTAVGGVPDTAYRDANTVFTLSFLRASLRQRIATKFRRYKLANDGTRVGPGQRTSPRHRRCRRTSSAYSVNGKAPDWWRMRMPSRRGLSWSATRAIRIGLTYCSRRIS